MRVIDTQHQFEKRAYMVIINNTEVMVGCDNATFPHLHYIRIWIPKFTEDAMVVSLHPQILNLMRLRLVVCVGG